MEVDFSVNAIRFKTKGFFYQGQRKVKFLEFRKPKDVLPHIPYRTHFLSPVKNPSFSFSLHHPEFFGTSVRSMEVDFSANAIRFKTKGFFYQGQRKVKFLEFRKPKDPAVQKRARKTMRDLKSWANDLAEGKYRSWLRLATTEFPPDKPKLEWLEPKLEGVRTGVITPETIRDDLVNSVLEELNEYDELSETSKSSLLLG